MRDYIDVNDRLQRQWFDVCKNSQSYHKPFNFVIPKLSGKVAHKMAEVAKVYKLNSFPAMFGIYTIWAGDPSPYIRSGVSIVDIPREECTLLYVGESGGSYTNDRKNKNSHKTYKKSSFLSRMHQQQKKFRDELNYDLGDIYLMVLCPPLKEIFYYGEARSGWRNAYEQTLIIEYRITSGYYPLHCKEHKDGRPSMTYSASTATKSEAPGITRWQI
mgnify:CR=1 FL=1